MIRPLLCLTALSLLAQTPPPPAKGKKSVADIPTLPTISSSPVKELVRADLSPSETGSPEALLTTLYAFISGPKDQKRDLEKIRALFHIQARILIAAKHPEAGAFLRPLELEAFLAFALPQWAKTGFFEKGLTMSVQKQGGLAQVWSPYEIRLEAEGPVHYTGINALQCAWDGKRWWITHLAFESQATAAVEATAAPEPKK